MTTDVTEEELLKLYTQIAGDSYGPSKPIEFNNDINNAWTKIPLALVGRLGLTAFSKIFDFVKNIWFPHNPTTAKKSRKYLILTQEKAE